MAEPAPTDALTLDPPGSIAIVGAGPLGIEAALYGRYLGFDVTLYEAVAVGASMHDQQDEPLPMLPDRCLSSLAVSALRAQHEAATGLTSQETAESSLQLPMTYKQWIEEALVPLTATDLLRNRLIVPARVSQIVTVPVEADSDDEDTSEIPPDFQLTIVGPDDQNTSSRTEAVILATGPGNQSDRTPIELNFDPPTDYFFQIGQVRADQAEQQLRGGRGEIVAIYAGLMGRPDLDLHRPRRG